MPDKSLFYGQERRWVPEAVISKQVYWWIEGMEEIDLFFIRRENRKLKSQYVIFVVKVLWFWEMFVFLLHIMLESWLE